MHGSVGETLPTLVRTGAGRKRARNQGTFDGPPGTLPERRSTAPPLALREDPHDRRQGSRARAAPDSVTSRGRTTATDYAMPSRFHRVESTPPAVTPSGRGSSPCSTGWTIRTEAIAPRGAGENPERPAWRGTETPVRSGGRALNQPRELVRRLSSGESRRFLQNHTKPSPETTYVSLWMPFWS
jgi:hypothetical protein